MARWAKGNKAAGDDAPIRPSLRLEAGDDAPSTKTRHPLRQDDAGDDEKKEWSEELASFWGQVQAMNSQVTALVASLAVMVEEQAVKNKARDEECHQLLVTQKAQEEALLRQDNEIRGLRVAVQSLAGRQRRMLGAGGGGMTDVTAAPEPPRMYEPIATPAMEHAVEEALAGVPEVADDLASALFQAIARGDEHWALDALSKCGPVQVNSSDDSGNTALLRASAKGLTQLCSALLDNFDFTDVNEPDFYGRSALHQAAIAGHAETCKVLLDHTKFKEMNSKAQLGRTALHCAAEYGHGAVAAVVLAHKRFHEVEAVDDAQHTALHHAAMNGHAAVCLALLGRTSFLARAACARD